MVGEAPQRPLDRQCRRASLAPQYMEEEEEAAMRMGCSSDQMESEACITATASDRHRHILRKVSVVVVVVV